MRDDYFVKYCWEIHKNVFAFPSKRLFAVKTGGFICCTSWSVLKLWIFTIQTQRWIFVWRELVTWKCLFTLLRHICKSSNISNILEVFKIEEFPLAVLTVLFAFSVARGATETQLSKSVKMNFFLDPVILQIQIVQTLSPHFNAVTVF